MPKSHAPPTDEAIAKLNAKIEKVMANPELLNQPKYASLRSFVAKLSKSKAFATSAKMKSRDLDLEESDNEESDSDAEDSDADDGSDKDCKLL